jgi:hypothetical protein
MVKFGKSSWFSYQTNIVNSYSGSGALSIVDLPALNAFTV